MAGGGGGGGGGGIAFQPLLVSWKACMAGVYVLNSVGPYTLQYYTQASRQDLHWLDRVLGTRGKKGSGEKGERE